MQSSVTSFIPKDLQTISQGCHSALSQCSRYSCRCRDRYSRKDLATLSDPTSPSVDWHLKGGLQMVLRGLLLRSDHVSGLSTLIYSHGTATQHGENEALKLQKICFFFQELFSLWNPQEARKKYACSKNKTVCKTSSTFLHSSWPFFFLCVWLWSLEETNPKEGREKRRKESFGSNI